MPGLYTGATGLWGGFTGLLYGTSALSTPPGLLADAAWSPAQLFTQGEQGAWYDPSDFSTMFQDSAGTTPVTAVQQPVGLILDKSQGLAIGSELISPINFTTGWSSSGAAVTFDSASTFTAAGIANVFRVLVEVGKWYKITFNISFTSAGLNLYNATTASNLINSGTIASGTSYTYYFLAAATQINFRPTSAGAVTVNSVTLTTIAGNHASQSTAGSRPTLSARVNLLTYSEQFNNAAWTKLNILAFGSGSVANAAVAPDGTTTADFIVPDTTNTQHGVYLAVSAVAGVTYTHSVYAKAGGYNWLYMTEGNNVTAQASFNLATGVLGTVTGTGSPSATITAVGDGWYRCTLTLTPVAALQNIQMRANTANGGAAFVGNGTSGIYIWGADLRPANQVNAGMPNYQRIAAATDYDTNGFPYYLSCDGGDSLSTATINPGSVDKAQVFAGVRKLNDTAYQILCEFSATVTSNNGSFATLATSGAASGATGKNALNTGLRGTALASYDLTTFTPPITYVASNLFDIGGATISSEIVPRVNGLSPTLTVVDAGPAGTGNFGSYPLYIGARAGSSLFFTGNIYGLIIRFSSTNLPNSTVLQVEDWMDVKTFGKNMAVVYSDELTTALGELITAADGDQIYMTVAYV